MKPLIRAATWGVAVLTAATLALAGCTADSGPSAPAGSDASWPTFTIATTVEPTSFDPAQAGEGVYPQFFQPVFDSLIRRGPDGSLAPMLATDWKLSDDGLTGTMTLRQDVTFSDGTAFNAEVAKTNLERFRDGGGPLAGSMAILEGVTAVDDHTIELSLSRPDPDLWLYLGSAAGYMASPAQFDSADVATDPIGSGAYVLDRSRTVSGSSYVYTKRDGYWDKDATWNFFDTLIIKPIPDPTARMNALVSGEADAGTVEPKGMSQVEASNLNVTTYSVNWYGLSIYDRGGAMVPALGKKEVRQAINYAIDTEAILKTVDLGFGDTTAQIFNPVSEAYSDELDKAYPHDVDKAKELLAQAGYADGFDVTMPNSSALIDPAAVAAITQDLAAVGIRVTWEEVPAADMVAALRGGKYAMAWFPFGLQPTAWGTISRFVLPTAPWNVFKTEDLQINVLAEKALASLNDENAYAEAVKGINQAVVDGGWFAPFYRVQYGLVTAQGLTGVPQAGQVAPSIYNYAPAR